MSQLELLSPWREFLQALDGLLNEQFELHCIGGFAVTAAYGLQRRTNDLDYFSLVPANRSDNLERLAGEESALARKYRVHIHSAGVASLPDNYEERLTEVFAGMLRNIRLLIPDPYDLVLSKLGRNAERDREDVAHIAKAQHLSAANLRDRFEREYLSIGPRERDENTLKFWIEAYFSSP